MKTAYGMSLVAMVAAAVAALAASSAAAPPNATRAVDFHHDRLVYKPKRFEPSEGLFVKQVHWKRWTTRKAVGVGRVPGLGVKMKIKLRGPQSCENLAPGKQVFSRAKLNAKHCTVICTIDGPAYFFGCRP